MADQHASRPSGTAGAGDAAVTGVARGSLGTATALEETQEWVIPPELQASASAKPAADPAELAARPAPQPAPAPGPAPEPVPVRPRRATTWPAPGVRAFGSPRTAGIAAALLVALIAVAAVLGANGMLGGPAQPPAADQATAPASAPAEIGEGDKDEDRGKNEDKGKGKGNGNGGGDDEGD